MTTRQLETFLSLAETGSFTETANRLFLTQPAVSQQIQALERDINCTLFIRSKTGLQLTPSGKLFYDEAGSLLSHTNTVYTKLRQSSYGDKVVRTLCYLPPLRLLPTIVSRFSQEHPNVFLSVAKVDIFSENAQTIFEQHDITVAFGNPDKDYPNLQFLPLYSSRLVCLMHRSHPLAQRQSLRPADLSGFTVYTMNEHPQNDALHQLNVAMRASNRNSFDSLFGVYDALVMASSGECVCVVPDIHSLQGSECVAVPLELPITFCTGLYVSSNAPDDVWDFCDIARALCEQDTLPPVVY